MDAVTRTWLGFTALGAGLVHLALAVGSPVPVAVGLVVVGAAEFGWGVFAFTSERLPWPWMARAGALVPVTVWALALVMGLGFAGSLRVFPMLAASILDLALAIGITAVMRHARLRSAQEPRSLKAPAYLAAMFAGALVVGAVTTPALAATEAGDYATHGSHGTPSPSETPYILHLPETGHEGH
jgi:hypothetical protein